MTATRPTAVDSRKTARHDRTSTSRPAINGPAVGVHVLVWCDGYNQAARMFDRVTMREFAMRVAFQMSAADSSNLIDSPLGNKLGQNRALVYSEEQGTTEKFRPYALPGDRWLAYVKQQLASRNLE